MKTPSSHRAFAEQSGEKSRGGKGKRRKENKKVEATRGEKKRREKRPCAGSQQEEKMKKSNKDGAATGALPLQLVLPVIEMLCCSISQVRELGLEYHALLERDMVHDMHTFIQFRFVLEIR